MPEHVPEGHIGQAVSPSTEAYLPGVQGVHPLIEPEEMVAVPNSQSLQDSFLYAGWYFPGGHKYGELS